jgi:hypothetical protein
VARGRKQIPIDFEKFEKLCGLQCTLEEIAGFFNVSMDTIERRCKTHYGSHFAEVLKRFSAPAKISLRRYQFKMARTNAGMAIWLGKQYLGQTDKVTTTVKRPRDKPRLTIPDADTRPGTGTGTDPGTGPGPDHPG